MDEVCLRVVRSSLGVVIKMKGINIRASSPGDDDNDATLTLDQRDERQTRRLINMSRLFVCFFIFGGSVKDFGKTCST